MAETQRNRGHLVNDIRPVVLITARACAYNFNSAKLISIQLKIVRFFVKHTTVFFFFFVNRVTIVTHSGIHYDYIFVRINTIYSASIYNSQREIDCKRRFNQIIVDGILEIFCADRVLKRLFNREMCVKKRYFLVTWNI